MNEIILDGIADFLIEHNRYQDKEVLRKYVEDHSSYGTLDYGIDEDGKIVGVVRFNLNEDGEVAEILDFAIREDFRSQGLGKDFILRALKKFPQITYLEFKRGVRGDERVKRIPIKGILKRNIF